jgi:hypothetical protein
MAVSRKEMSRYRLKVVQEVVALKRENREALLNNNRDMLQSSFGRLGKSLKTNEILDTILERAKNDEYDALFYFHCLDFLSQLNSRKYPFVKKLIRVIDQQGARFVFDTFTTLFSLILVYDLFTHDVGLLFFLNSSLFFLFLEGMKQAMEQLFSHDLFLFEKTVAVMSIGGINFINAVEQGRLLYLANSFVSGSINQLTSTLDVIIDKGVKRKTICYEYPEKIREELQQLFLEEQVNEENWISHAP